MDLYKNGFVVAEMNSKNGLYNAWPLSNLSGDKVAESLTDEADDNWFIKYEMQHIVPDLNYVKIYHDYCNRINLQTEVLLFESLDNSITINNALNVTEVIGFDCIGTVYYSYLQNEYEDFKSEFLEKKICLNKYGLLDSFEDVLYFIKLRKKVIASGVNLEDFWRELPVKISIVDITK